MRLKTASQTVEKVSFRLTRANPRRGFAFIRKSKDFCDKLTLPIKFGRVLLHKEEALFYFAVIPIEIFKLCKSGIFSLCVVRSKIVAFAVGKILTA